MHHYNFHDDITGEAVVTLMKDNMLIKHGISKYLQTTYQHAEISHALFERMVYGASL